MTGIERLREWEQSGKEGEGCPPMSGGIASDKCDAFETCNLCRAHWMREIADQIERETLPRPLFEDGEPVQFGDRISIKGCNETARGFKFYRSGPLFVSIVGRDHEKWVRIEEGERLKRPEPPDCYRALSSGVEYSRDGAGCCGLVDRLESYNADCLECEAFVDNISPWKATEAAEVER